jgi:hypothetical protein
MKNTNELTLIDGHFSPDEAEEILMNIFSGKIDFHQNKNFSSEERFGKEDATALKRIPELRKSMNSIAKIIEAAKQNNETLQITAEVKINLFKP